MPWIFRALFSVSIFCTILYFFGILYFIPRFCSVHHSARHREQIQKTLVHSDIPYHFYIVVVVVNVIVSSNNHLTIAVIYFETIPDLPRIQNDNMGSFFWCYQPSCPFPQTQKSFKRGFPRARCAWNWIYTTGIFPLQKGHSSHWPFSPYGTSSRQTAINPCYRRKTKGPPNSLWLCDKQGVSFKNAKNCSSTPSWTRPSVKYAKDWMDHSFLFPGLVCSGKGFHFGCDH